MQLPLQLLPSPQDLIPSMQLQLNLVTLLNEEDVLYFVFFLRHYHLLHYHSKKETGASDHLGMHLAEIVVGLELIVPQKRVEGIGLQATLIEAFVLAFLEDLLAFLEAFPTLTYSVLVVQVLCDLVSIVVL